MVLIDYFRNNLSIVINSSSGAYCSSRLYSINGKHLNIADMNSKLGDNPTDLSEQIFFEKRFHRLAESDMNSDCTFLVGPNKVVIKGHKLMFCVASEVFQAMFYGQLKEGSPVQVEDLEPDGFEGMKKFIYCGEITFNSSFHALSSYIAARKYLVPQLTNVCTDFIEENLQPSEVLEFYALCTLNKITEFDELCSKIIQERTDEVVGSEYFLSAEMDSIELILKAPTLKLRSEIEVFEHFERWALAEVDRNQVDDVEVASRFNKLKKHIRFLTIKGDEFVSKVGESTLLSQEEKQAIAFNQIKPDSKPMPESLSISLHSRSFTPLQTELHQSTLSFVIPIDKDSRSIETIVSIDCNGKKSQFRVRSIYFDGLISFALFAEYAPMKALFIIKAKFRVKAVKKCGDLVFESEHKSIVNKLSSGETQNGIVLAVIPTSKLKNEQFIKSTDNQVVNIEGSFKIEKIDF